MSENRRLRRQARKARRAGLEPVVILDGRFPPSAAEVVTRIAVQYRSELAPLPAALAVFLAGWFAHLDAPHWYPVFIISSAIAAWLLVVFGDWLGLPRPTDRAYAGLTVFSTGGWVAFAAVLGPLDSPLPWILGAVALILAVPWWLDRRRRARARVQRKVGRWPEIARAVGLPGSAIVSLSVEVWGWRAWLRLAYGQTIADVVRQIPAIESALCAVHGAVQVYPAPDGKANWCEIRVIGADPGPRR